MNKLFLGSALLLCGALAIAQDTAPTSGAADTSSATSNTVQGCLSGTSGNYMLTDATGATYQLQGDESQLANNVNKEIEVTGTLGSSASASATNSPDATPGSTTAGQSTGSTTNPNPDSAAPGNAPAGNTPSGTASAETGSGASATASVGKTLSVTSVRKVADSCTSNQSTTPQQ